MYDDFEELVVNALNRIEDDLSKIKNIVDVLSENVEYLSKDQIKLIEKLKRI